MERSRQSRGCRRAGVGRAGHTDVRAGSPSSALQVQEVVRQDPLTGHLLRGRRGDLIRRRDLRDSAGDHRGPNRQRGPRQPRACPRPAPVIEPRPELSARFEGAGLTRAHLIGDLKEDGNRLAGTPVGSRNMRPLRPAWCRDEGVWPFSSGTGEPCFDLCSRFTNLSLGGLRAPAPPTSNLDVRVPQLGSSATHSPP